MSDIRTFKVGKKDRAELDRTVQFNLEWQDKNGGDHTEGPFTAYPGRIPESALLRVPNMRVDQNSVQLFKVLRTALCGPLKNKDGEPDEHGEPSYDEWDRFDTFINRDDVLVEADQLAEIMAWLTEESTRRPTTPS